MKYKLIAGSCHTKACMFEFDKMVQDALDDGWEPMGGVAVSGNQLLQAVVKRAK